MGEVATILTIDPVNFGLYYCEATSNDQVVESDHATLSRSSTIGFVGGYIQFVCDVSDGPDNTFQQGPCRYTG